jgi:hypothetical protein
MTKYDVVHLTIGKKSGWAIRRTFLYLFVSYRAKLSKNMYFSSASEIKDFCLFETKDKAVEEKNSSYEIIVKEDTKLQNIIDGNN